MADEAVLKEFLVQLGYKIDAASQSQFTNSLLFITNQTIQFARSIEGFVDRVVGATSRMANSLEQLYFASQRTGASAEELQTLGQAAAATGSSVAGMQGAIEQFAQYMALNPGAGSILAHLGIDPNQDPGEIFNQLGKVFAQMKAEGRQYEANLYAQQLHIPYREILSLENPDFQRQQNMFRQIYMAAGYTDKSYQALTKSAHEFANQMRYVTSAFEVLKTMLAASLFKSLHDDLEKFRILLIQNFPRIQAFIEDLARVILRLANGFISLIAAMGDAVRWFDQLSTSSQHMVEAFGAAFAILLAGKPQVMILAYALLYLLALLQDYQRYKEGKAHFIDWKAYQPIIDKLAEFGKQVDNIVNKLGGWQTVLISIIALLGATKLLGALSSITGGFVSLGKVLPTWEAVGPLMALLGRLSLVGLVAWLASKFIGAGPIDEQFQREQGDKWQDEHPDEGKPDWVTRHLYGTTLGRILGINQAVDKQNAGKDIMKRLVDMNVNPTLAAGMAANAAFESSGDPMVTNSTGHTGLFQYDQAGQERFFKMFGHRMNDPTIGQTPQGRDQLINEQLKFALADQAQWSKGQGPLAAPAGLTPQQQDDLAEAQGKNWDLYFERSEDVNDPNGPGAESRAVTARHIYRNYYNTTHNTSNTTNTDTSNDTTNKPSITVAPNTTINVIGGSDPHKTAQSVADHQARVTQDATHSAQGATR